MNPFPPPRAYVDWEVPLCPDGTRLVSTRDQRDYEYYISWLADYLYEKEILIPENQRGLTGFPCFVPDAFDPFAYDDLVYAISEGVSYEEFVEEVMANCDAYLEEMRGGMLMRRKRLMIWPILLMCAYPQGSNLSERRWRWRRLGEVVAQKRLIMQMCRIVRFLLKR